MRRKLNYDPYFASRPSIREKLRSKRTKADIKNDFETSMSSSSEQGMMPPSVAGDESDREETGQHAE